MEHLQMMAVNALRILSADMVQKANSGHPGLPLGCAPIVYELWGNHMSHNPKNPDWFNRDRFILSAGHGSALLYALLHLYGYGNLSIEELKQFRQLDSLTPGHPEYHHTIGVEATTGPLGAGMGMAVGMAMAERHLAAKFNREHFPIVDHYTFVLGGDGCMMEGISSEAFSLAGTLGLHKLIVLYDSNDISIEGSTEIAFSEDVRKRFEAFGFQTLLVEDGNDLQAIGRAIEEAKKDTQRPSMIMIKTQIGFGCPAKQGKASAHGEALGEENVAALRETLQWPSKEAFLVPEEVREHYQMLAQKGAKKEAEWNQLFAQYTKQYPELRKLWDQYHTAISEADFPESFWAFAQKPEATRNVSGEALNRLKTYFPNLIGGSADLAPSNRTNLTDAGDFSKENYAGRNLHFGVRELAMAAISNGIALHGGLKPFIGTFFVFSDYMKPMARLAALMKLPVIYILTHDSIGVGEDGPTHEPIEQLSMLRAMPNFVTYRPADATETMTAWYHAMLAKDHPTALVLSRQNLPQLPGSSKEGALKGGYIIADAQKAVPDAIVIASGSEVQLGIAAKEELAKEGIDIRVVSMPSMDVYEMQEASYQEQILPKQVRARVAIEAGSSFGWGRYVGLDGATITMEGFGASAPFDVLFERFGFTKQNVIKTVKNLLKK